MGTLRDSHNTANTLAEIVEASEEAPWEDAVAGGIILLVGFIGIFANCFSSWFLFRQRNVLGPFSIIFVSQSLAESGVLLVFSTWSPADTIIHLEGEIWSLLSRRLGQLSMVFWFAGVYAHLLIALNRFCAIVVPSMYRIIFTDQNTVILVAVTWVMALMHGIFYFFPGCDLSYNADLYYWQYSDSPCGQVAAYYLDFMCGVIASAVVLLIDVITVTTLHFKHTTCSSTEALTAAEQRRRRRRDVQFFLQAFASALIFTVMLISFHILVEFARTKWEVFFATTFAWTLSHTLDGFLLFVFNRELRNTVCRPRRWCRSKSVIQVSHVTPPISQSTRNTNSSTSPLSRVMTVTTYVRHLSSRLRQFPLRR